MPMTKPRSDSQNETNHEYATNGSDRAEKKLRVVELEDSGDEVRVAIYVRQSSDRQKTIPEQVSKARKRAEERGWSVRYVLKDDAQKGQDFERPMFQRLFDLAERQAIDVVLVWKIDRLARSLAHACVLEEALREDGVAVHSCTEPIDTTTPTGRFIFGILASAAQLEIEILRERIRLGFARRAKEGVWCHPTVPFGYRRTKGRHLRIYEPEAEVVRAVFDAYEETMSCAEAANLLQQGRYRPRRGKWTEGKIREILENELYGGTFRIGDSSSHQKHLEVVPHERYRKVRRMMSEAKRRGRKPSSSLKEAAIDNVFNQYLDSLKDLPESR